ncbi:MAG: metal ABC transporter substrate-binding protein, partial [Candidatus Methylomirabilota bacterium]
MPSTVSAALVLLAALAAGLVGLAPAAAQADAPLPVVASGTVIADLVRNVGGDSLALRPLAPAGTDPHTFQPTPDSMRALARARLAFFNGSGLEEWWGRTVRSVGRKELTVVELSRGLATLTMPESARGG